MNTSCLSRLTSEKWLRFELFAFIYISLSHDCFRFEFIGFYTGSNHKQMLYIRTSWLYKEFWWETVLQWLAHLHTLVLHYQTYGSVSPVQATYGPYPFIKFFLENLCSVLYTLLILDGTLLTVKLSMYISILLVNSLFNR